MNIQRQCARYSIPILVGLFIIFQLWKIKSPHKPLHIHLDQGTNNEAEPISELLSPSHKRKGRFAALNGSNSTIGVDHPLFPNSHRSLPNMRLVHFPHGDAVRPFKILLSAIWVPSLKRELTNIKNSSRNTKQVSVVVSDSQYKASVVNWLVAALVKTKPPITNLIVIALDQQLQDFLLQNDIQSVYVDPRTVIRPGTKIASEFSHIWITRNTIYRLLNYWGYDVVAYDSDATVLRNLQPIFDEYRDSDVIGSAGKYPFQLGKTVWGYTLCMGVALFRSTNRTDMLWEAMGQTKRDTFDDQVKINFALQACHIQWQDQSKSITNQSITGQCEDNLLGGLRVTILAQSIICRHCQHDKLDNSYYVWHDVSKKQVKDKIQTAQEGNVWYLKDNWNHSFTHREQMKGLEWLRAISK